MVEALLLFFVFLGEAGLAQIIYLSRNFIEEPVIIFFCLYALQLFFATFQAGASDHYCRRKSLIFALVIILIAQGFFFFTFKGDVWPIFVTVFLYGALGNITPIARAALVDTELKKDFRLSIGLSTVAIALGWIAMLIAAHFLKPIQVCSIVTIMAIIGLAFLIWFFKDPRDLKHMKGGFSLLQEVKGISKLVKHKWFFFGLMGYFVAEVAFYQIFCFDEGNLSNPDVRFIVTTWVIGYCIGVLVQTFGIKNERFGIMSGSYISIFSILLLVLFNLLNIRGGFMITLFNFLFSFGFGFFVPCVFAFASKRFSPHLQGKLYGLIDATDALGILCGVGLILFCKDFGKDFLILSSGLLILVACSFFRSSLKSFDKS